MPEFNSLEELVIHFGYKKELYEEYLQSLSLEDLKKLIDKPNFWKKNIEIVGVLRIFHNDIKKTKILIENIVQNNVDEILNDDNSFKSIMTHIKGNAEALNYFLSLLPKDKINKVLDYLFESRLDLNLLSLGKDSQQIIEEYISKCTSILEIKPIIESFYHTLHLSTNNLGMLILEEIIYANKFHWFWDCFKDSIYPTAPEPDAYYDIPSFKQQEKIIEILFLLLNVPKGLHNSIMLTFDSVDENQNYENQNYIIALLGELSKKQSERLIYYLNNLVQNNSYLSLEILKNPILIQYIEPDSIISSFHPEAYDYNATCTKVNKEHADAKLKYHKAMSYEELKKKFFYDDINPNLINRLDTNTLLKIFPFNYFIGLNDKIIDIIKEFLSRYFTYERAIFFIRLLNLSDRQKIEIITDVYHVSNIDSIELEKDTIIAQAIQCILDFEEPVPDYFKAILPELISMPYDEALYEELKDICLQIDRQEYLQVFLSQYFKYECEKKKMNYWDYHINFSPKFNTVCGNVLDSRINIRLGDYPTEDISQENGEHMDTVNHEKTHFYQYDKMPNIISIYSLMVALSIILSRDEKYYDDNYFDVFHEVHARIYGVYDTYKSLKEVNPDAAKRFLIGTKNLNIQNNEADNEDIASFKNDRKKSKDVRYFSNLINTFFERIPAKDIVWYRQEYKTLELITNEQGIPYTPEEIEGFINSFKASDLRYDANNKALYTFYIRYLHLLNDGLNLQDNRINIYDTSPPRRRTS